MKINKVEDKYSIYIDRSSLNSHPTLSKKSIENHSTLAAQNIACDSIFSRFFQAIRDIFSYFFGSKNEPEVKVDVKKIPTAQELEQRIEKGCEWIKNDIDEHFGNENRNLSRDKFLVVMSYNGMSDVSIPTTHPVNIEQFKTDTIRKFKAMMRSPHTQPADSEDTFLRISTHFIVRRIRQSDGAVSPWLWHGSRAHSHDYFRGNRDNYGSYGEKIENSQLTQKLNELIPQMLVGRQATIDYASGALNW